MAEGIVLLLAPPARPSRHPRLHVPKSNKDGRDIAITVGSAALAAPALSVPIVWVVVCLGLRLVAGSFRRAKAAGEPGPTIATVTQTLEQGIRRTPSRAIPSLVRGVFTLATAFVLIALFVGVPWLAEHGPQGVPVAVRLGIHQHLLALFCALVCWRILRGRKGKNGAVEALVDVYLQPAAQIRLVIAGGACLLILVLFVFAMPRAPWAPWGSFEGAVAVLPTATRDAVFDLRRDLVGTETAAVLRCLTREEGDLGWRYEVGYRTPAGSLIVRITRGPQGTPTRANVSTLALALHHQLSGGVTRLLVRRSENFTPLVIDRTRVSQTRPLTDTEALATAARVSADTLPYDDTIEELGLKCGAQTL